jgi:hypothetical protein
MSGAGRWISITDLESGLSRIKLAMKEIGWRGLRNLKGFGSFRTDVRGSTYLEISLNHFPIYLVFLTAVYVRLLFMTRKDISKMPLRATQKPGSFQTVLDIKEVGRMGRWKDTGYGVVPVKASIMGFIRMAWNTVMGSGFSGLETATQGNGRTHGKMDLEFYRLQMAVNMLGNGEMVEQMAPGLSPSRMVTSMRGLGARDGWMVLQSSLLGQNGRIGLAAMRVFCSLRYQEDIGDGFLYHITSLLIWLAPK